MAKKRFIKKKELIYPDLRSPALRSIWHSARSNFVFFVVFVNIHRAFALRLLEVQRKREANGTRPLIMRGILKSRQLVENLRLSLELLSYAFHKITVNRQEKRSAKIALTEEMQIDGILFDSIFYIFPLRFYITCVISLNNISSYL